MHEREFMNIMPDGMNLLKTNNPQKCPPFPSLNEIIVFFWKIYVLDYVNLIISLKTLYLHYIYVT